MTITSTATNSTNVNTLPVTVTLQGIADKYGLSTFWASEQEARGNRVARCRRYYDGDHDMTLNSFQKALLQVKDGDDGMALNLMPSVVDSKADRCIVQAIEGVEDDSPDTTEQTVSPNPNGKPQDKKPVVNESTKWAQEVMDNNDFDVIQDKVHRPAIRDGNNYVMVSWDNVKKQVALTVEPAWDGQSGMLMVYQSRNINKPYMAIKVWQIDGKAADGKAAILTRINSYQEGKVDKYLVDETGQFTELPLEKGEIRTWVLSDGTPIGIPIVPFRNDVRDNYGVSELRNAIPVQNALNRFHNSSIIAAELTAFPIYFEVNLNRDETTVMPGMVIKINDVPKESPATLTKIEASDMTPILDMIEASRRRIAEITRTPSPDLSGGSQQSGEFLKQLEIGLVGKCNRFMNEAGSSWEQVFDLAWKVQQAFGTKKPPAYKRFVCRWKSPEIRNDTEVVTNAMKALPLLGEKQTMRNLSIVYPDLTEEKIEQIMQEKADQKAQMVKELGKGIPDFGGSKPSFGGGNPMMDRMGQQVAEMSKI